MDENTINNKEGEDMLALKKDNVIKNEITYTPAKNEDVMKAIMNFNKKYPKMMEMLSK